MSSNQERNYEGTNSGDKTEDKINDQTANFLSSPDLHANNITDSRPLSDLTQLPQIARADDDTKGDDRPFAKIRVDAAMNVEEYKDQD